jgi:hypothetical protein
MKNRKVFQSFLQKNLINPLSCRKVRFCSHGGCTNQVQNIPNYVASITVNKHMFVKCVILISTASININGINYFSFAVLNAFERKGRQATDSFTVDLDFSQPTMPT